MNVLTRLNPLTDDSGVDEGAQDVKLKLAHTSRKTTEIVTQRIVFSGGHEETITFSVRDSHYETWGTTSPSEVPYTACDFDGNVVLDAIEQENIATVTVLETSEVAYEHRRVEWAEELNRIERILERSVDVELLDVKEV